MEDFTTMILSASEIVKGKIALKVSKLNNEIAKINPENEVPEIKGFTIPKVEDDNNEIL